MPENQELVWVDKDFAAKINALTTKKATRDQQEKVFDEYMKGVTESIQRDFRASLEGLDEDATIFTGLMLKVKQAFEKAKNEHLVASEELWEKFEAEIPSTRDKVQKLVDILDPLTKKLTEINSLIGKINTWDINKLNESIALLASSYGKNKEMVEFLVTHFGKDTK